MNSLSRELRSFDGRLIRLYKQITHADLVAAVNGESQDVLIAALPAGVYSLLASSVKINTFFTGGGATAVTCAIGTGASPGDPDSIIDELNVFDTTATGIWIPGTKGVTPTGPKGGSSIYAEFDLDAGHTLLALTAGDLEVELLIVARPDEKLEY